MSLADHVKLTITLDTEVRASAICVGDTITAYKIDGAPTWQSADWLVVRIENGRIHDANRSLCGTDAMATFRIRRSTAKPAASKWNGTCPRCKRGTYTGFTSVEHEGGVCQQSAQF